MRYQQVAFHESIVEALTNAQTTDHVLLLAALLCRTRIPTNHWNIKVALLEAATRTGLGVASPLVVDATHTLEGGEQAQTQEHRAVATKVFQV